MSRMAVFGRKTGARLARSPPPAGFSPSSVCYAICCDFGRFRLGAPQMRCPQNMPKMPLLGVKNVIFTAAYSFKCLIISMWKKSRNPCPADACLHLRDSRAFFPFMQHVPPVDATRSAGRCDVPRRLVWRVASFCVRRYVKKNSSLRRCASRFLFVYCRSVCLRGYCSSSLTGKVK